MLRLMEAAESLSITDWKLLTDVFLLGLAESEKDKVSFEDCGADDTGENNI